MSVEQRRIWKRIEAVITGTIGNRVVLTGSGVRIPSLPPNKPDTNIGVGFVLVKAGNLN